MTARSLVVYCAATEVGKINTDDTIARAEWNATGITTACPGCDNSLDAGHLAESTGADPVVCVRK